MSRSSAVRLILAVEQGQELAVPGASCDFDLEKWGILLGMFMESTLR